MELDPSEVESRRTKRRLERQHRRRCGEKYLDEGNADRRHRRESLCYTEELVRKGCPGQRALQTR
jgi:hypothetical protein